MVYALIVIYNKNIEESLTYKCLRTFYDNINFVIFDNGDEQYIANNKDYCDKHGIKYFTLLKNVGLPRAYNHVISNLNLSGDDHLMILDDDTNLTHEYCDEIKKLVNNKNYDICLPKIKAGNMFISPAKVQFNCRIKAVKDFSLLNSDNISAINSGMVVRASVYNKIKYNDKLFLDYVDHDFMRKARKIKCAIKIMDSIIEQNYFRFQVNSLEKELFRFKIYVKDFKIYCRECNNMLFYHVSIFKYKLHQIMKYKSLKFLFIK